MINRLKSAKTDDVDWVNGRSWSLIDYAGDEHPGVVREAYDFYFSEKAADPAILQIRR